MRGLEGSERQDAKRACHNRSAERLRDLCFANGGIYIKFGQHVAQLVRLGARAPDACARAGHSVYKALLVFSV